MEKGAVVRVTLVHDYATQMGGAERVVCSWLEAFPDAPLLTSVVEPAKTYRALAERVTATSFLQHWTPARRDPRRAVLAMPAAFSSLTVDSSTDIVLVSSSGFAHGIRAEQPVVVYCHSPARWLWAHEDYAKGAGRGARLAISSVRAVQRGWDKRAAARATTYIANSRFIRDRIHRAYGIDAEVVHPPVGLTPNGPLAAVPHVSPGYVLAIARSRGYKNVELITEAVAQLGMPLVIVGGRRRTANSRGMFTDLDRVNDEQLRWLYANASVFVSAGREDFGLTPIEANGLGTPVVALGHGGALETVVDGETGLHFRSEDPSVLAATIARAVRMRWDEDALRQHAASFSPQSHMKRLTHLMAQALA
ncbi:glycosyltransferase [Geodermatophilus sp. SYSU D00965]